MKGKAISVIGLVTVTILLFGCETTGPSDADRDGDSKRENRANTRAIISSPIPGHVLEMGGLYGAIEDYHRRFGVYPQGDNVAISKQLLGDNPMHRQFFLPPSPLGPQGELMDQWGTPFRITITQDEKITIQSAGPNRIFDDSDDLFVPPK